MDTTQVITLNSNSTNAEIAEVLENNAAFQAKKGVLVAIEPTSNVDVVRLLFVQQTNDVPVATSTVNPLLQMAMGWKQNDLILRAWLNADTTIVQEAGISIGDTGEAVFQKIAESTGTAVDIESVDIKITDSIVPRSWLNGEGEEVVQNPLTTSSGRTLTHKGQLIYRNTDLVLNHSTNHVILSADANRA